MRNRFLIVGVIALLGYPATVSADQKAARPITQLDFDRPAQAEPGPMRSQIDEVLGKSAEAPTPDQTAKKDKEPAPAAKGAFTKTELGARARLAAPGEGEVPKQSHGVQRFDWVKPEEGSSHFLIPRLKGPATDVESVSSITTKSNWKKEGAGCGDVSSTEQLIRKAESLKELLNRFTGGDEFFESQCSQSCSDKKEAPALTAFAVREFPDGEFKMTETDGTCAYVIASKSQPPHWQMVKGERGYCTCLPKSVLK